MRSVFTDPDFRVPVQWCGFLARKPRVSRAVRAPELHFDATHLSQTCRAETVETQENSLLRQDLVHLSWLVSNLVLLMWPLADITRASIGLYKLTELGVKQGRWSQSTKLSEAMRASVRLLLRSSEHAIGHRPTVQARI